MKRNISKLMMAIYYAYQKSQPGEKWAPRAMEGNQLVTYCNEVFNSICKAMDYKKFDYVITEKPDDAFMANQIFDMMKKDWQEVSEEQAQRWANEGAVVAAAWKNLSGDHGHICVVIPGELTFSGQWDKKVPIVMNVGASVFIGKPASYAFGKDKYPTFFVLESA